MVKERVVAGLRDAGLSQRVAETFGKQLQQVRQRCGWKQEAFAEAMGVSRTTASNLERGRHRVFLDHVYRAAAILSVPVTDLIPESDGLCHPVLVHASVDDPLSASTARALSRTVAAVVEELELAGSQGKE